jgi:hypothetical protein
VGEGTGLGLPISRDIIQGLGGELSVDSRVGEGSTFRVFLPVVGEAQEEEPRPVRNGEGLSHSAAQEQFLVRGADVSLGRVGGREVSERVL